MDKIVEEVWDTIPKKESKKPIAIFMMGLPASGKSTSIVKVAEMYKLDLDSLIHVDPDIFMSILEGYDSSKASDFNKIGVQISSKILSKIYETPKYNYVYYGTGKSYTSYITMINKAKKLGYETLLVYVKLDVLEAIKRSKKRQRRLSESIIKEIDHRLKEKHRRKKGKVFVEQTNFEILQEKVDNWIVLDNS
jgi:predicted kinase